MAARAFAFLALLSVFFALPVFAAPDAGVVTAAVAPPVIPSTTTTTTVATTTPGVKAPMLNDYTVLIGGVLVVGAFFLRRMTDSSGWFHTRNGGYLIVFVSGLAASCAEAFQQKGFSKSVFIAAAGQFLLTFVAMTDTKPTNGTSNPNAVLPPDPPKAS